MDFPFAKQKLKADAKTILLEQPVSASASASKKVTLIWNDEKKFVSHWTIHRSPLYFRGYFFYEHINVAKGENTAVYGYANGD